MGINLTGIYMQGDVWLSRQTIKGILNEDLDNVLLSKEECGEEQTAKEYIKRLIQRLDKLSI